MSMTQMAFLNRSEMPTNAKIQEHLQGLGYDFEFVNKEALMGGMPGGREFRMNGKRTMVQVFTNTTEEFLDEFDEIEFRPEGKDTAISFIWGADFVAGTCVLLLSLALIDLCDALSYYLDDQMEYTREMHLDDLPVLLKEIR